MLSLTPRERTLSRTARVLVLIVFSLVWVNPAMAQSPRYAEAFTAYQNQKFGDAETIWIELANAGDVNAQYALGVMHLRNEAGAPSLESAFSWFEMAASQGHATSMFNLGVAYWEGAGVQQDKHQALLLWEESADKGESGAQFNLGLAYYIGEERDADLEEAAKWIGLAAEQNHPEAKRILKVINEERESTAGSQPAPMTTGDTPAPATTDNTGASTVAAATQEPEAAEPAATTLSWWRTTDRDALLFDAPDGVSFRTLPASTPLEVTDQQGNWARVAIPGGLRTWIYARFIDISGDTGVINAAAVRVRPEPSTDNATSPPIGKYPEGARVSVLRQQGDWVEVLAPDEIGAWVRLNDIIQYQDSAENREADWERARAAGV